MGRCRFLKSVSVFGIGFLKYRDIGKVFGIFRFGLLIVLLSHNGYRIAKSQNHEFCNFTLNAFAECRQSDYASKCLVTCCVLQSLQRSLCVLRTRLSSKDKAPVLAASSTVFQLHKSRGSKVVSYKLRNYRIYSAYYYYTLCLKNIQLFHCNLNKNCPISFFIARQHPDARYWYSKSVCLSVCPSVRSLRSGILWKRLKILL